MLSDEGDIQFLQEVSNASNKVASNKVTPCNTALKSLLSTIFADMTIYRTQRLKGLVQNVILKLEKINIVFVKPVMVKHP